jgi:hypothetical protein
MHRGRTSVKNRSCWTHPSQRANGTGPDAQVRSESRDCTCTPWQRHVFCPGTTAICGQACCSTVVSVNLELVKPSGEQIGEICQSKLVRLPQRHPFEAFSKIGNLWGDEGDCHWDAGTACQNSDPHNRVSAVACLLPGVASHVLSCLSPNDPSSAKLNLNC